MPKILISGAGGAPSENVIRSLIEGDDNNEVIGFGSEPMDLMTSMTKKKYYVPYAVERNYKKSLLNLLVSEKPVLIHFQHDIEIREASRMREDIINTGTKIFMPQKEVIETCVDKAKSSLVWQKEGIKIPKTLMVNNENDLKIAFETLGNKEGKIWIRATVGGGGKGALPTDNFEFAKMWIDRFKGWGNFTAAELLDTNTVTWLSIWYEGELVVAQTRKRNSWNFGDRTLSGITGITRVGETYSNETVNKVAMDAIQSIDKKPNGIYGVDMTYDFDGFPNPTEINISRFFTTVYFFTKAGLNMPQIFADIALKNKFPSLEKKINPLPDGLLWLRGMDREPLLTTMPEIEKSILGLKI